MKIKYWFLVGAGSLFLSACGGAPVGSTSSSSSSSSSGSSSSGFSSAGLVYELDAQAMDSSAVLRWEAANKEQYNLIYSESPDCNPATYTLCPGGTLVSNITSPYTVKNLLNGRNYWFKLQTNSTQKFKLAAARPNTLLPNGVTTAAVYDAQGTAYILGEFNRVGAKTGSGVTINLATEQPHAFAEVNGTINAVVADGNGGWYIGGAFSVVGWEQRNNLAHINADGTVSSWAPSADNAVNTLTLAGNRIYITGSFTRIGTEARNNVAAIDLDGKLTSWNPGESAQPGWVSALAINNNVVYICGNFDSINGIARKNLAAVDTNGKLLDWAPTVDGAVSSLAVADNSVYLVGSFRTVDGVKRMHIARVGFDGRLSKWDPNFPEHREIYKIVVSDDAIYLGRGIVRGDAITALNKSDGSINWERNTNRILALATDGKRVYMAGYLNEPAIKLSKYNFAVFEQNGTYVGFKTQFDGSLSVHALAIANNVLYAGGSFKVAASETRHKFAGINADGTLNTWQPAADETIKTLQIAGDALYFGGSFTHINSLTRNNLAAVDKAGNLLDWAPNADGQVKKILVLGTTAYVFGDFTHINGSARKNIAAIDINTGSVLAWNPTLAEGANIIDIAVDLNDVIYIGAALPEGVNPTQRYYVATITKDGAVKNWQRADVDSDAGELGKNVLVNYLAGAPSQTQNNSSGNKTTVEMLNTVDDGTLDTAGIDIDLVKHGQLFLANFDALLTLSDGAGFDLIFKGEKYTSTLNTLKLSQIGDPFASIKLGASGGLASIYYGKEKKLGNIYSSSGSYVFEQKGKIGYMMDMNEYRKIKNALGDE